MKKKASLENNEYNLNTITPIGNYNEFMNFNLTTLRIDWKQILESLLGFEVGNDFLIIAKNSDVLRALVEHLDSASDRIFANFFFLQILIDFREVFSLYFLPRHVNEQWGTSNAAQRFEQCTKLVRENLPVAFTSLLVRKCTNKQMIDDARDIANRTLKLIIKIVENDDFIPENNRKFMVDKLKTVKLIIGYPDELLVDNKVEKFHEGLKLTGNETFFQLYFQAFMFEIDKRFSGFFKVDDVSLEKDEAARWSDYTTENEYVTPPYKLDHENAICKLS